MRPPYRACCTGGSDALYAASSLATQEDDLRRQLAVLGGHYDRVSAITAIIVNRQAQDHAEAAHRRDVAAANVAGRADDKLKIVARCSRARP